MSSPTIYTPDAYPIGSFEIPSDGNEITASSVNVALKAIADGVKHERVRRWWDYRPTLSDLVTPVDTVTASDYTDVIPLVNSENVAVGDSVHLLYTTHAACNGSMSMRLVAGPNRALIPNAFAFRSASTSDISPLAIQGAFTVTEPMLVNGVLSIYLQAKVAAPASLVVWAPHALAVEIERP